MHTPVDQDEPLEVNTQSPNDIELLLFNAISIVNYQLGNFPSFIYSSNLKIIVVTESWLSSTIYDKNLPCYFAIFRNNRI